MIRDIATHPDEAVALFLLGLSIGALIPSWLQRVRRNADARLQRLVDEGCAEIDAERADFAAWDRQVTG